MNKVLAIVITALLLTSGNAQAHCGKCGVGDAPKSDIDTMLNEKTEMLTKKLNLTDDQKAKVQAILKEKMAKKQEIMDQKHNAMDALHEEFKAKLGAILTEEQMKNWEEMKKDSDGMMGKCPMCKDGKMCEVCKLKKGKSEHKPGHPHEEHEHTEQ